MPVQMRGGRSTLVPTQRRGLGRRCVGAMAVVCVVQPGDVCQGSPSTPRPGEHRFGMCRWDDHNAGTEGRGAGFSQHRQRPKRGYAWGTITRIWPVPAGRSRILHDQLRKHRRRSNGLVRVCLRGCPRGGSHRMHTDSESVQRDRTAELGRARLIGKPLVIEARVPLVMERRKRVGQ